MDNEMIEGLKEFGMTFVLPLIAVGVFVWVYVGISYLI